MPARISALLFSTTSASNWNIFPSCWSYILVLPLTMHGDCPFSCGADCVLVVIVAPMCLATNSFVMLVLASQSIVSFMALVFVDHVNEW